MRHRLPHVAAIITSLVALKLPAQMPSGDPVGTWRGTSTCQVRPSACHDETAVYHITRMAVRDSFAIDGRRVVNGEEVEMGVLSCRFDATRAQLTCAIPQGVWRFTIRGDSLVGEMRSPDGTKTRDVRTARSR